MEKLKIKPNTTKKEARSHPSLGLVYSCPKCGVGHSLTHTSSNNVKCNLCGLIYQKP